ncbi:hypothetical protein NDI45_26385 [Leptolyngbya sp. GB1-A1]|uniref:hypothetical protein n=1 Tax=Leptolyngbya sp. GB1-A1 TaxID=2933908 RepID=UPI003296FCA8
MNSSDNRNTPASGSRTVPLAFRLSDRPKAGRFSVLALTQIDQPVPVDGTPAAPLPEELEITAVALTLADGSGAAELGLRIPLAGGSIPLKLKLAQTSTEQSQIWDIAANQSATFDIYAIANNAELPAPQSWRLNLDAISDAESLIKINANLNWSVTREDNGALNQSATLETQLNAPFLQQPLSWNFAATNTPASGQISFSEFTRAEDQLKFSVDSVFQILDTSLPFVLSDKLAANLLIGLKDGKIGLRLETGIAEKLIIDLGSPLAQLTLTKISLVLDSLQGLAVSHSGTETAAELALDIFAFAPADDKFINNLWFNDAAIDSPSPVFDHLLKLSSATIPALPQLIFWQDKFPRIRKELLAALGAELNQLIVNEKRKLQAFTGDLLGTVLPCRVRFQKPKAGELNINQSEASWTLQVPLTVLAEGTDSQKTPIFRATGQFGFNLPVNPIDRNYLDIQTGAFAAEKTVDLEVTETIVSSLSDLISLSIPQGSVFRFYTDPRRPQFEWQVEASRKKTPYKIAIRIPASQSKDLNRAEPDRFTFEMSEFALRSGGFDLKGAVRVESVPLLGDKTGFSQPLAVKEVQGSSSNGTQPPKIGEIAFRQSRLVAGSLQASTQLTYFDDAIVTFTLLVSQNEVNRKLAVVGSVEISALAEFHVDALFATFQIDVLHLQVTYSTGKWSSTGATSGRIKFLPPQGRSAGEMGELAALFKGITAEFESLNPVELGAINLRITFPPQQFEFASIFAIDLRGIQINQGAGGFGLLGDITLQRLPGVDTQLTFGGITLKPQGRGQIPTFDVAMIGASFKVAGGFEIDGALARIKDDRETGFGGAVRVKTEALSLNGLVKLTFARTLSGEAVPTLAVYLETEVDISLFAGFFLRSLGVGLGVNQALDGLQDKTLPLPQRINRFVNDPKGLPDPQRLASWVPNPPARSSQAINWMLVASGLITYGRLPSNQEHPLAGGILLAIDQDLDIVAGVNLWLFTTLEQTEQTAFIRNPAARGAIAISPREQQVYGLFRTLKNPKLSDRAPQLLGQVLSAIQTSLMFVADRNGFLYEIGWPWETKIQYELGPLRGELLSGYRFGIYRGVISFGLNYAVRVVLNAQAEIGFNTRFGGAGASLSVYGEGYFRCSFIGALTSSFTPYLLGKVQIKAIVEVKVSAYAEFSAKIFGKKITLLKINFSAALKISISASLTAAMEGTSIGFDGVAQVAVSIAGYQLSGKVPLRYNEGRIKQVEDKLVTLLPRPSGTEGRSIMARGGRLTTEPGEPFWNYHFCWVGTQLRVLIFPRPEQGYPAIDELPSSVEAPRFRIRLEQPDKFQGFLGSARQTDGILQGDTLTWTENLNEVVMSAEEIRANRDPSDPIENYQDIEDLQVRNFLASLSNSQQNHDRAPTQRREVIDIRTQNPASANVDDETAGITREGVYSPNFKPDYQDDSYDRKLHDACTLDTTQNPRSIASQETDAGLSPELLVAESLSLIKDTKAQPGVKAPDYTIAAHLNLVLVFDAPEGVDPTDVDADPVGRVLDLNSLLVQEKSMSLRSAINDSAREYDLIPGVYFQSKSEICLTWTFKYEDEDLSKNNGSNNGLDNDSSNDLDIDLDSNLDNSENNRSNGLEETRISEAYRDLDRFVVTRTILQRPTQTSITEVRPAWLQSGSDSNTAWIRPQYQFVDDFSGQADAPQDGDLVRYVVEARTLNDRVLTRCIINVVRQTIEPLQPPSQSLALHRLQFASNRTYEPGKIEIAIAETEQDLTPQQLRLRYRLIPASTVGDYGFEVNPGVQTQWSDAIPGQQKVLNGIDVRFADAAQSRPMPWDEVQEFTVDANRWQPLVVQESNQVEPTLLGYRLELEENEFWQKINSLTPGMAVELFVGREDWQAGQISRSPLVRCRHAVQLPTIQTIPDASASDSREADLTENQDTAANVNYFGKGNTVNAIEKLPTIAPETSYLDPSFVQVWANYPPQELKDSQTDESQIDGSQTDAQPQLPITLQLLWRHDLSCRGGANAFCPIVDSATQAPVFAPVTGYRIYRADAYSPIEYIRDDAQKTLLAKPELTVRAVPELMYKSQPGTIEVSAKGMGQEILADWQQAGTKIENLWASGTTATDPNNLIPLEKSYAAAPIWLFEPIQELLETIRTELDRDKAGHRYILKFRYPLEDRSPDAVSRDGETLRQRIEKLIATLDPKQDPFGWWALESLGLSCECIFEDAEGYPIDAKNLIDRLREALPPQTAFPLSLVLFLAEDGVTFLNVFRILCASIPPAFQDMFGFGTALGLRLMGRKDRADVVPLDSLDSKDIPEADRELLTGLLTGWLKQIRTRWSPSTGESGKVSVYQFVPSRTVEKTDRTAAAQRSLPIDSEEGLIRYELPVPDRWAHQYAIALQIIRRYDLLWSHLQPQSVGLEAQPVGSETQRIPYRQLKHTQVDRSQPLVSQTLVALPMVGGIQSIVFVHPAAFAATASAVNAVHGQYSGQRVFLQRRIKERQKILQIYQNQEAFPVEWDRYQVWLNLPHDDRPDSFETIVPGPQVLRDETGKWNTLALDPMQGTESGIYAADRYVFPDLPGYYEYQVGVYSTAGRVCSPITQTEFVTPLYDQATSPPGDRPALEQPRQQPRSVDCRDVVFDPQQNRFQLKIRLIHARYHLRDEISPLWVNAEERLALGGQEMRYGSLPDLYLNYQLYLRVNPNEKTANPVLLPLAEIRPPLGKAARAMKDESEVRDAFVAQAQAAGVVIQLENDGDTPEAVLPVSQAEVDREIERLAQGELYFDLTLALRGEASAKLLSDIRAYVLQDTDIDAQRQRSRNLIYLAVAREGIWSDIQPIE